MAYCFASLYRIRTDNAGVRCEACHGATNALYPAYNPYGEERDVIQPMQYSETPFPIGANISCETCHKKDMDFEHHHKNMLRNTRNF